MNSNVTKFTHIKFLSVLKTDSIPSLLNILGETFKTLENTNHQDNTLVVYRDILFSEQDMSNPLIREKEYRFLQQLLAKQPFKVECLASWVVNEEVFYIPSKNVINDGRTVCTNVYPELDGYIE